MNELKTPTDESGPYRQESPDQPQNGSNQGIGFYDSDVVDNVLVWVGVAMMKQQGRKQAGRGKG